MTSARTVILALVLGLLAITGPAAHAGSVVAPETAVAQLNDLRAEVGVRPVQHDATMSANCARHADYFRQNPGTSGHFEDPSRPGYSAEGHQAAATGNLAYHPANAFIGALDWEPALYHRASMLAPRLARSGYWAEHGIACQTVLPRNAGPGVSTLTAFPYPYDGQAGVAVDFGCNERPNPCDSVPGASASRPLGMLLSLQFDAPWDQVGSPDAQTVLLREVGSGRPVEVVVEDRDSAHAPYLEAGLALLPTSPLEHDADYEVHVTGTAFGRQAGTSVSAPFDTRWRFRTVRAEDALGDPPQMFVFGSRDGSVGARTFSPAPVKLTLLSGERVLAETTMQTTAEPDGRRMGKGTMQMPQDGALTLCGEQQPMRGFAHQRVCTTVPPASSPAAGPSASALPSPPSALAPAVPSSGAATASALRTPGTVRFRGTSAIMRCPSSCSVRLTVGRRVIARGAGARTVKLRLTQAGRRLLRGPSRVVRATLTVTLGRQRLSRTVSVRRV